MNRQSDQSHFSSARDFLDRVHMADILISLGAKLPRHGNRLKNCLLCKSESYAFGFDESKGVWHCFSCGAGGGKVALVSHVHNCKPQEALKWIAGLAGIELDRWSKAQASRHTAAMKAAGAAGRALVEWRNETIDQLREHRDVYQRLYHWAIRIGRTEEQAWLWELVCDFDRRIQWHRDAPWTWLADIHYYTMNSTEVAA